MVQINPVILSTRYPDHEEPMHYVYILESKSHPEEIYIGFTEDLERRLGEHNAGRVPHTSKFMPWKIRRPQLSKTRPGLLCLNVISNPVPAGLFFTGISDSIAR